MTYEEFRKAHPARRIFMRYSSEQRANRAASHRLGHRQRQAVGEFFYEHDMIPDRAFSTAKDATTRAYKLFLERQAPAAGSVDSHVGRPEIRKVGDASSCCVRMGT
jgi:hypothetical protein